METKYNKIDINFILLDEMISYDIYIKLNERYLKIIARADSNKEELLKLKFKGFDFIYLGGSDYERYLQLKAKSLKEETTEIIVKKNAELFVKNNELLNKLFKSLGYHDDKINCIRKSLDISKDIWNNSPDITFVFKSFDELTQPYMVKKQLEIYLILSLAKYLPEIKEQKMDQFLSAIICMDLKLNDADYWNCYNRNKLNTSLLNHSVKVVEYLPVGFFYTEITGFIKTHHETIDGQGFPLSFKSTQLSIYNVIYNLVDDFTFLFFKNKVKINKSSEIMLMVEKKYQRYFSSSESDAIKKVISAMKLMVNGGSNG